MKKIALTIGVSLMALSLAGCDGNITKQDVGTVGGAVAGGVIGSQFGSGAGNTAATIGGAVVGGYVGNQLTKD
jgi:uncharacterized protein YcfJ